MADPFIPWTTLLQEDNKIHIEIDEQYCPLFAEVFQKSSAAEESLRVCVWDRHNSNMEASRKADSCLKNDNHLKGNSIYCTDISLLTLIGSTYLRDMSNIISIITSVLETVSHI